MSWSSRKLLIVALLAATTVPRAAAAAVASASEPIDLLLVQSYDQLMSWDVALQQAVVDTLGVDGVNVRLAVENLDSKVHHSPEYYESFSRLLALKYRGMRFDLVLTSDNNALTFVLDRRDTLFPGAPVVFCGLNGYTPEQLADEPDVTGVAEVYSARQTIDLALRLFPGTRTIYVLNDNLITGRAAAADIDAQLADLRPGVAIEHSPPMTLAEHKAALAALPRDTIVLLGVFYADRDGVHTTFEQIGSELVAASARPVFCVLDLNLASGVVGGRLVSGYGQGAAMAGMARQVLAGTPPAALPVIARRANRWEFNGPALERWGIAVDALPDGSIVRDLRFSPWRAYRREIVGAGVVILVLLVSAGGMAFNIRRRRESERRLRRSEESLAVTLASIGDGVVATDDQGRIVRMNPQAVCISGWEESEARGRRLAEVLPVVDLETGEPLPDPVAAVIGAANGSNGSGRGLLVTRDGTERVIEDSGAVIRGRDGEATGVVMVFRDVTARNELEDRLRHSQKLEAVGQLAGGVAHDFNNMLAGIMGYAEMAREDDIGRGELKEFMGHILAAAVRASDLTRKLLAFSRKGKVLSTAFDVHEVIREAEALLARSVDRRIELRLDLAAVNSSVVGDPTQLQQAVLNLGLNARDAMPEGGVLTIATRNRWLDEAAAAAASGGDLNPGDYLVVTVSDTGSGIPADVLPRIFEPFFTTKPVGEGTGLGLAAVRGTVADHHGAVLVHSTPGAGTTFEILLPLSGAPVAAAAVEQEIDLAFQGTLLVVDDEPVLRGMVQRMLTGVGWRVVTAADGAEGLAAFRDAAGTIDVVLLDMVMPRMDGRACFRAIRALDPAAKVILASGFAPENAVAELMAEGLAAYLKKPYRQSDLMQALARVLAGGSPPA